MGETMKSETERSRVNFVSISKGKPCPRLALR